MAEDLTTTGIPSDTIEKDERDTPDYWRKWIRSAERAAKDHWETARQAWAEYENRNSEGQDEVERSFPIYWSSCKVIEPALYSRTPKITTRRRFDINDDTAITACIIAERLGTYLVEQCEFDQVMQAAVQDYLHADKTTTQLLYSHESEEYEERTPLVPGEAGAYLTESGESWSEEVFQDGAGFFGQQSLTRPINQRIYLAACRYDEILHTPDAKCEGEIRERAFYFCMNKDEAEARFGDKAKNIHWKSKKTASRSDTIDRERVDAVGEYVEGWEIWSKPNRRVYWFSDQYSDGFLDSVEDPYKLKEFFPAPPFAIGSKPSRHLYPTPAFIQVYPLIVSLHDAANKVSRLISAIRRRAIVDPSLEDLVYALESLESGEFIAAKNFGSIVEKGGVDNLILYLPVKELVESIQELTNLQEKFKNEFYEWFGIPDILRGATEPLESASAQMLKVESAHDRFKWCKKQIAQIARDSIELMLDLALGVFDDSKIADCVGYEFLDPEDQQRFPAALQLLRSDNARTIRIEVDSDTMSFVDEQMRINQTNQCVKVITGGLKEVAQMIPISPQAAAVGLQALLLSLDALPAGKEFHDEVKQTLTGMIEQAKQPPKPQPPPPDYEMLKLQFQQQKAQMDNQLEQQRMALDAQTKSRDLERREYELQLKAGSAAAEASLEEFRATFEQQLQQFMAQLEAQRVAIESFKAQMQARESEMEEIRLAREVDARAYQAAVESAQTNPPESATPPVFNVINVESPKTPELPIIPVLE